MIIPSILDTPREQLPFPSIVDNSILSAFKKCEMYGEYKYISNLTPTGTSVHLHAGGAFAHGIEAARRCFYEKGRPAEEAIALGITELLAYYGDYECPPESPKSALRMAGALEYYFSVYRLGTDHIVPWTDGKSTGIEFSFSIPLSISHPETGEPIVYVGRFDMLGKDERAGTLWVVDEKTASSLGGSWAKQWELDSQFTGYCAAARIYKKPVVGAMIRGVSILKTKYDTVEVPTYRPQWMIERWWKEVHRTVERMIQIWANPGEARLALDKGTCGSYGGCDMNPLCAVPDPANWMKVNFEPRTWHPRLREEREEELRQLREAANATASS